MNPLELLLLGIVTIATRIVPRLVRPYAVSSDAFYHMLAARRIRENRFRLPRRLRGLCFPGPYDYPPLFHYLLALAPERMLPTVEMLISPAIDVAYVWLLYAALVYLPHLTGWQEARVAGQHAWAITTLFAVSPALLYTGKGPRAYNANPRVWSELLFGIVSFATLSWYVTREPASLIAAGVALAVLLLSSKFGAQVTAFFYPLLALLLMEPALLWIPVIGFGVCLPFWRGHYLTVLRAHVGHLALFGAIGDRRGSPMARRSEWHEFMSLLGKLHHARSWYRFLCLNSISSFLVRNPQLLLLVVFASALPPAPAVTFLSALVLVSVICFLVVSYRRLLFLGEAERYVSYALPGQYVLLALIWDRLPPSATLGLAAYCVGVSAVYQALFINFNYKDQTRRSQGEELHRFFATQPKVRRVMPIGEAPYNLAYVTNQEVFYPCGNFQVWETPVSEYLRIYEDFLFPRRDTLTDTLEKYELDSLVINKRNDLRHFRPDAGLFETIFENDTFQVVDVRRAGAIGNVTEVALTEGATA